MQQNLSVVAVAKCTTYPAGSSGDAVVTCTHRETTCTFPHMLPAPNGCFAGADYSTYSYYKWLFKTTLVIFNGLQAVTHESVGPKKAIAHSKIILQLH